MLRIQPCAGWHRASLSYGLGMASSLEIYLQNHEAAAQAGSALFHRAAVNQGSREYGDELRALAADVMKIIAGCG